jgi:hypothetical protein
VLETANNFLMSSDPLACVHLLRQQLLKENLRFLTTQADVFSFSKRARTRSLAISHVTQSRSVPA